MMQLRERADVYTPGGGGAYTTLHKQGLRCRLMIPERSLDPSGFEREVLGNERRLLWDASYDMPEEAVVVHEQTKYQVVVGTNATLRGQSGKKLYSQCRVLRMDRVN